MKQSNYNIIRVILILGVLSIIILSVVKKSVVEKNNNSSIELSMTSDYHYFNNSIEEFAKVLMEDLKRNKIVIEKHSEKVEVYNGKYKFNIELDNGDTIKLYSDKADMIKSIECKSKNTESQKYFGKVIGTIARLYTKSTNLEELEENINNNFLTSENIAKKVGESYVYSHLLFSWTNIENIYTVTFEVVPEENQEQHLADPKYQAEKAELERQEAEKKAEKERKEAEEREEKKRQEEEAKKRLAKKARTFTAGTYIVGEDIEAGTYNMIAISGRGNCYVSSTSSVIETFTPSGDKWAIARYNNVRLSSGGTIEVTSTLKIKFEPVS